MKTNIILLCFGVLLGGCNSKDDYIKDVYVNFQLNLSLPEYSNLNTLGNSMFVSGGNAGIIIYHFGINEYKIYDRNCSYEPSLSCSYIDSINSTIAYCNCCTSAFLLDQDGTPVNAPALLPLKQYHYTLEGQTLYVFN